MFRLSPVDRAWIRALLGPFVGALFALVVVASVVLSAQIILRAPFVPGVAGVMKIWAAMLPETFGVLAPPALLIAVVVGSRAWSEQGDLQALAQSGHGGRILGVPTLAAGVVVALMVLCCSQVLGPWGRTLARNVVVDAAADSKLRPGSMIQLGDVWVRVGARDSGQLTDIVIAADSWVAWAPRAERLPDGLIRLYGGQTRGLDDSWHVRFAQASISAQSSTVGIHNFERGYRALQQRIERMESNGKSAHRERLTLYKRATLPLAVPLLALLGLPIGVRAQRPALITGGVILSVWAVQRMGDHGAAVLGPTTMAVVPLIFVMVLLMSFWTRWWAR